MPPKMQFSSLNKTRNWKTAGSFPDSGCGNISIIQDPKDFIDTCPKHPVS